MLNNFLHDFAVAVLFACLLVLTFIYHSSRKMDFDARKEFARELYRFLNKIIIGCWVFIIVGGVIRTLAYEEYEWLPAAGRGQVAALILKHILLVVFVIRGTIMQIRLRKIFKRS